MNKNNIIAETSVSLLRAPLIQHFRTALGDHRSLENLLFKIKLESGIEGFGEAAIATHITGETLEVSKKNLKAIGKALVGLSVKDYQDISQLLHERLPKNKAALAGVEMAVLDALAKSQRIPLWKFFGKRAKPLVSDITIVIADLKETEESVQKFYKQGFRQFKIKIGRDEDLDLKRVQAVHRLAPKSDIYLDANQGYSAEGMLNFINALQKMNIQPKLIEQPVVKGDWVSLKKITRSTKIPVCADESVATVKDAQYAIKTKSVSVINIKTMKSGFIEGAKIARLAEKHNIKLMIGGMLETSLAMTASAHMAAGLGCFDYIDLDTPFFIKDDVKKNPYLSKSGTYRLSGTKPGIGITRYD